MKTLELDLPEHWAVALMYGDTSHMEDADIAALDRFTDDMVAQYGKCWVVAVSDSVGGDFRAYHDARPFGVLACNVLTCTFDIDQ